MSWSSGQARPLGAASYEPNSERLIKFFSKATSATDWNSSRSPLGSASLLKLLTLAMLFCTLYSSISREQSGRSCGKLMMTFRDQQRSIFPSLIAMKQKNISEDSVSFISFLFCVHVTFDVCSSAPNRSAFHFPSLFSILRLSSHVQPILGTCFFFWSI